MAITVECGVCFDTKGLCTAATQMKKFFDFTLRQGFEKRTVLPCYARSLLLNKYGVKKTENRIFHASFMTPENFEFALMVTNEPNITSISGDAWKEFCRVYQLQIDQQVYFYIDKLQGREPSRVVCGHYPIIHPTYYHLGAQKREIVDRLTATDGTEFNWRMMEKVITEVNKLEVFVDHNDAGDYDVGRAYGLLHTLNWSNYSKNFMKLPRRLVPHDMDASGAITIVCDPSTRVASTYTTSTDDGRVCINKWDKFMAKEAKLEIGHKLLMMLYLGDHGTYLFVSHVPDVALE